jgi:hypothetical protein
MAVAGTLGDPLPDEWFVRAAEWTRRWGAVHMFSVQPTVRPGDRLVMYASGTPQRLGAGRFFAVREAVAAPEPSVHERWPWMVKVRDVIAGPDLPHCPSIEEIGVLPTSLRRHTHIKLASVAGGRAEALLELANQRML